eukprot:sb/3464647/
MTFCNMSLRECQTLYFNLKDVVFKGSRPYNTEILENFMKEQFGENRMMNERSFPRVIVPATIADCRPCKLHVFRNYGYRSENGEPAPHQQRVWEAARSSSAAPTYFTPHKRFVDGGLMANNPTITMLTEMHDCNQDLGKLGYKEAATPVSFTDGLMRAVIGEDFSTREQDNTKGYIESRPVDDNVALVKDVAQEPTKPYIVVSLGTGLAPEVAVKDFNVSAVSGPLGAGRLLLSAKEFAETLVEQCAATDGAVVLGAKAWCESIGSYYFRLQPQLSYNMKMDEVENKNLIDCLWDVQCFVYQNKDHMERITDLLIVRVQGIVKLGRESGSSLSAFYALKYMTHQTVVTYSCQQNWGDRTDRKSRDMFPYFFSLSLSLTLYLITRCLPLSLSLSVPGSLSLSVSLSLSLSLSFSLLPSVSLSFSPLSYSDHVLIFLRPCSRSTTKGMWV